MRTRISLETDACWLPTTVTERLVCHATGARWHRLPCSSLGEVMKVPSTALSALFPLPFSLRPSNTSQHLVNSMDDKYHGQESWLSSAEKGEGTTLARTASRVTASPSCCVKRLTDITLDDLFHNRYAAPLSLRDFELYLVYVSSFSSLLFGEIVR
jgi:hypothetical protein